jgi:NADPH2:quinone reductase
MTKPQASVEIGAQVDRLARDGFIKPIVGARFPLERTADALNLIDGRGALGKVVLEP